MDSESQEQEWRVELVRNFTERYAPFFPRFEQCRLRFWGRPVHFVGEHDIGKDRPGLKLEEFLAHRVFLNHIGAGNIGGHEIRSELDTRKFQMHDVAQRGNELRLSQPRHALEKNVTAGKHAHNDAIYYFAIPDDDLGDFFLDALELLLKCDDLLVDGSAH